MTLLPKADTSLKQMLRSLINVDNVSEVACYVASLEKTAIQTPSSSSHSSPIEPFQQAYQQYQYALQQQFATKASPAQRVHALTPARQTLWETLQHWCSTWPEEAQCRLIYWLCPSPQSRATQKGSQSLENNCLDP